MHNLFSLSLPASASYDTLVALAAKLRTIPDVMISGYRTSSDAQAIIFAPANADLAAYLGESITLVASGLPEQYADMIAAWEAAHSDYTPIHPADNAPTVTFVR